jgi:hypothetical protein
LSLPKLHHLKLNLKAQQVSKVNLTLILNVLVMLNISGVKGLDIKLQSVQTKE